jgi:hypothetical protein
MKAPTMTNCKCMRCGATFILPMLEPTVRDRITALVRDEHTAPATQILQTSTDLDLVDCKGIVFHITRKKGYCHRCKKPLVGQDQVVCENCTCLNLDW